MTIDAADLPADTGPVLAEADVRAIVRLLGDIIATGQDHAGAKRQLLEGVCGLVDADAWTWSLGRIVEPGEQPVYIGMAHGGLDAARYSHLVLAASHSDMAWTSEKLLAEMRERGSQVTRRRQQVVDEAAFAASGVDASLADADIGPFIFSLRPIEGRAVSTIAIFRRRHDPPFSERETRIAHILLSELSWLHEQGWPTDRGATVPHLSPRQRTVLNLLLDGRTRKEMAGSLSLSLHTVAQYQKAIYRHFGVRSHATLIRRFQMGNGGDR